MSFDAELCFWIAAAVVGIIAFGVMMFIGKRVSDGYVGE